MRYPAPSEVPVLVTGIQISRMLRVRGKMDPGHKARDDGVAAGVAGPIGRIGGAAHFTLERKSALRFSRKAAAPSFDSSVW